MRTILEHLKRGRENEAFAMAFLFDSAEVGEIKRARNTGPRPGGVKRVRVRLVPGQHVSGAFGINDGGYHKWAATQSADKTDTGPSYAEWRKQMESVRKDIECFFGRFKSRFRMFKTPLTFHDKGDIDNAFFTCVALQNILLEWNKTQGFVTTWEVDAA